MNPLRVLTEVFVLRVGGRFRRDVFVAFRFIAFPPGLCSRSKPHWKSVDRKPYAPIYWLSARLDEKQREHRRRQFGFRPSVFDHKRRKSTRFGNKEKKIPLFNGNRFTVRSVSVLNKALFESMSKKRKTLSDEKNIMVQYVFAVWIQSKIRLQ